MLRVSAKERAAHMFKKALILEPDNAEAAAKLKVAETKGKDLDSK